MPGPSRRRLVSRRTRAPCRHPHRKRRPHEVAEQEQGGRVGPVQVVEYQQQRVSRRVVRERPASPFSSLGINLYLEGVWGEDLAMFGGGGSFRYGRANVGAPA